MISPQLLVEKMKMKKQGEEKEQESNSEFLSLSCGCTGDFLTSPCFIRSHKTTLCVTTQNVTGLLVLLIFMTWM